MALLSITVLFLIGAIIAAIVGRHGQMPLVGLCHPALRGSGAWRSAGEVRATSSVDRFDRCAG